MSRTGCVRQVRCFLATSLLSVTLGMAKNVPANPTFTRDVAPILYAHCVKCHHSGDIAPMSLLTYKEVRPWAAALKEAVVTRKMPPWKADEHYGKWANDARLSQAEIATIAA